MMEKEYPEEGELVVGTVVKVRNFGAFVSLDEYPHREGFIHIAEIATGWVKRIRNHIKEKQKVVCKVMNVDKAKDHIDLSLKRVNEHQRREKIQEWKNRQKARKLLEMVAQNIGKTVAQCYEEFGNNLIKHYGSLYAAFEEVAYNAETLKNDGFSGDWLEAFTTVAKDNITMPFVQVKGFLQVNSWLPDGVKHIRDALLKAEQSEYEDVKIKVKYVGAPNYSIMVEAPDYKIAEDMMKKAVKRVCDHIQHYNGQCEFGRNLEK
jgi:translation initiation factor 2 subunit 1